jgi:D-alanyl-D-alanine carboxypeptidase
VVVALLACAQVAIPGCGSDHDSPPPDDGLDQALQSLVAQPDGPPGAVVVAQRGENIDVHTAGVADLATPAPIEVDDHMRLGSIAKAFSGAAALAVVAQGALSLDDTIGQWRPALPLSWAPVTLRQLLGHTSGIDDFTNEKAFQDAVTASPTLAPPPSQLLSSVENKPLAFAPGSRYRYSNSDNIIVGLMIEAATGEAYEEVLRTRVYASLDLSETSLPSGATMPTPLLHGYEVMPPAAPEDISELVAAGWSWASGGVVSTPADATRFVRGYVSGKTTDAAPHAAQLTFMPGSSEPPGPGENAAGLALFRYTTQCGTVYGHTGNIFGYTQFAAASEDGQRSVTVSVSAQITPQVHAARFLELRHIFELGVCAALA